MKNIVYATVAIVLCVSLFLTVKYAREVDTLQKKVELQQVNDYPFLQKMIYTVNDQYGWEGSRAELKNLQQDVPYLCILYLSSMCEPCIQELLADVAELKKSVPGRNLLVITDYTGKRDRSILRNKLGNEVQLLHISEIETGKTAADLATLHSPLLFVADRDKRMKSVLLFIPELPAYNRTYYRTIRDLYFK